MRHRRPLQSGRSADILFNILTTAEALTIRSFLVVIPVPEQIPMTTYDIAVVHGDGIGPEVCSSAVEVLRAIAARRQSSCASSSIRAAPTNTCAPAPPFPRPRSKDAATPHAILHGATGIPGVTYADGTETGIEFGLQLRFSLDLYANVRPIRLRPGVRLAPGRSGARQHRLRHRAREHRGPVCGARRRRRAARRDGGRFAGDHAQGHRTHLPLRLRTGARPQRRARRRQEARDLLRQGQRAAQLRLLPQGLRRCGARLSRTSRPTTPTPTR